LAGDSECIRLLGLPVESPDSATESFACTSMSMWMPFNAKLNLHVGESVETHSGVFQIKMMKKIQIDKATIGYTMVRLSDRGADGEIVVHCENDIRAEVSFTREEDADTFFDFVKRCLEKDGKRKPESPNTGRRQTMRKTESPITAGRQSLGGWSSPPSEGKSQAGSSRKSSTSRASRYQPEDDFGTVGCRNSLPKSGAQSVILPKSNNGSAAAEVKRRGWEKDKENNSSSAPGVSPWKAITKGAPEGFSSVADRGGEEDPAEERRLAREARFGRIDTNALYHNTEPERIVQRSVMRRVDPRQSDVLPLDLARRQQAAPQRSSLYMRYRSVAQFEEAGGLKNLGNTCYLNAAMQAFNSLREFCKALSELPTTLPQCQDSGLYHCSAEILQQMSAGSMGFGGALSPAKLRERVALSAPMFGSNGQQDAHEFLLEYVNQLHDELLAARIRWFDARESGVTAIGTGDDVAGVGDSELAVLPTQQYLDSEVHKRLVCMQCQCKRDHFERFRDFSLDLTGQDGALLPSMLCSYFAEEVLEVRCEKCPSVASHLHKAIATPPRILILHLKRFVPNVELQRYDKNHQSIVIPSELDLRQCMASGFDERRLPARPLAGEGAPHTGEGGLWYDLRSVITHEGASPRSGHYVCYAKSDKDVWRLYDDSVVKELSGEPYRDLGRKAYILFYVMRSPSQ